MKQPADEGPLDLLSGQDAAYLAWESASRPMHIGVLASFRLASGAPQPSIEALRRQLAPRIAREPRFGDRLLRRGWLRRPAFVAAGPLDLEEHIRLGPTPARGGAGTLASLVDRILTGPLDPSRPLWEFWLLPQAEGPGSYAIVAKVHHSLLDGIAGVGVLERLLGGVTPSAPGPRAERAPPRPRRRRSLLAKLRGIARLVGRVLKRGPRTALNGEVGLDRHHGWLAWNADALDAAGSRHGATLNDALLAGATGGLRQWLAREPDGVPPSVRAFCPVNVRAAGQRGETGNHLSLWIVDLPLDASDAAERVRRIRHATRGHKRRSDSHGGAGMARLAEWVGLWFSKLAMGLAARRRAFSILVTNIPGPSKPLELLGARLERLVPFAPLLPGQRLAVALVSYAGELHCGISDGWPGRQPGERFVRAFEESVRELCDAPVRVPLAPPACSPSQRSGAPGS